MEELIREHGSTIAAVVVLIVLALIVARILKPKKPVIGEGMTLNVKCSKCGWQGTVTKYNQVCRKCNSHDLASF